MTVQPNLISYIAHGVYYDDGPADATATHVCFAIDDLPELAEQLYLSAVNSDDAAHLYTTILDRLRGDYTETPNRREES